MSKSEKVLGLDVSAIESKEQQSKPDCRDVAVQSSPDYKDSAVQTHGEPTVTATTGRSCITNHLLHMVASALYIGHSLSNQCRKSSTHPNLDKLGLYIVSAEVLINPQ